VFASFEEQPLAAASIAQVHVARFLDGREGAVFHLAYAGYTHSKYARLWAKSRADIVNKEASP